MITSGRNICGRGRMDNNARSNDGEEVDPSDRPTDIAFCMNRPRAAANFSSVFFSTRSEIGFWNRAAEREREEEERERE